MSTNLQTKIFTITKKNRKYFAALLGNCDCKIVIDENSSDLEPGRHELLVRDVSIRTKYGTDLIFELVLSQEEKKEAGFCTLKPKTPVRNRELIKRVHNLGGIWDITAGAWVFPKLVEDAVDELDAFYNSNFIPVEIEFQDGCRKGFLKSPYRFLGFELAAATQRDSGARVCNGVSVISGGFLSGGSYINWETRVKPGTVIRMMMPLDLIESAVVDDGIKIRRLDWTHSKPDTK